LNNELGKIEISDFTLLQRLIDPFDQCVFQLNLPIHRPNLIQAFTTQMQQNGVPQLREAVGQI